MIAAIHQPIYLPWHRYFAKISAVDVFVILDDVQYPRSKSYFNRNCIKTANGRCYLTVPVLEKSKMRLVKDTRIDNKTSWQRKHWRSISLNYRRARYYNWLYDEFYAVYVDQQWQYLCDLSVAIIEIICLALDIKTKIVRSSELGIKELRGFDKILSILKEVDCSAYLTSDGAGSKRYIGPNHHEFRMNCIELRQLAFSEIEYRQVHGAYMSNCSIIDLLFNCGASSYEYLVRNTKIVGWGGN